MKTHDVQVPWKASLKIGLVAALVGYIVAAVVMVAGILRSTSSTAAIGFLFVPFYAIGPAVPCFVLGYCAGYFKNARKGAEGRRARVAWLALGISILLFVAGGAFLLRGQLLVRQVQQCGRMDGPTLNAYFQSLPAKPNKFVLGALAQNPSASAELLDAISRLEDPELHLKMGSVFPLLGENRKGLAVMRLVARNPNVETETLVRLAASEDDYVLGDVVMSSKTPTEILHQAHAKGGYLLEWGLAYNPQCPSEILTALATSTNEYTRSAVAKNAGTPTELLKSLARDPVWHVRRGVAYHPDVPRDLLEELARDPDERVGSAAEGRLSRR